MNLDRYWRDKAGVRRNFERAAGSYDQVSVLQRTIGQRLLEHLEVIRLTPTRIVDLGAGTGLLSAQLARRYAGAQVIQLDLAFGMLQRAGEEQRVSGRQSLLCADAEDLPLAGECVELAFSNLMLQWVSELDRALAEVYRVLHPGGLFLFATFGPDSLRELRASWAAADDYVHVNAFTDMHDVGDALVRAGFVDPVLETEPFTLIYDDVPALFKELKNLGAGNVNAGRRKTLAGGCAFRTMQSEYRRRYADNDGFPATFEAVYGHAWAPEVKQKRQGPLAPGVFPVAFPASTRSSFPHSRQDERDRP